VQMKVFNARWNLVVSALVLVVVSV